MLIYSVGYAVYRERDGQLHGEQRQLTIEASDGLRAIRIALEQIEIETYPDQTVTNVRINATINHDVMRSRKAG